MKVDVLCFEIWYNIVLVLRWHHSFFPIPYHTKPKFSFFVGWKKLHSGLVRLLFQIYAHKNRITKYKNSIKYQRFSRQEYTARAMEVGILYNFCIIIFIWMYIMYILIYLLKLIIWMIKKWNQNYIMLELTRWSSPFSTTYSISRVARLKSNFYL